MTYGELNLKKLREDCDLDFAHYTYKSNQCSCCYGPEDLPARYWRKGAKPPVREPGEIYTPAEYSYILFKNANNGSGTVTKYDTLKDCGCISWGGMDNNKLIKVCEALQEQVGTEYKVIVPENEYTTIIIEKVK